MKPWEFVNKSEKGYTHVLPGHIHIHILFYFIYYICMLLI